MLSLTDMMPKWPATCKQLYLQLDMKQIHDTVQNMVGTWLVLKVMENILRVGKKKGKTKRPIELQVIGMFHKVISTRLISGFSVYRKSAQSGH